MGFLAWGWGAGLFIAGFRCGVDAGDGAGDVDHHGEEDCGIIWKLWFWVYCWVEWEAMMAMMMVMGGCGRWRGDWGDGFPAGARSDEG